MPFLLLLIIPKKQNFVKNEQHYVIEEMQHFVGAFINGKRGMVLGREQKTIMLFVLQNLTTKQK
jgi:hypothetical protein